ncbi:MAG: 4Fe-4S binding protein [Candidatus Helarchaeota archaeon]
MERNPHISLVYGEIEDIDGYIGNFKVKVKKKPRYIRSERCNACGSCAEVCPVMVPNEFNCGLDARKAIYIPFTQAVPATYTIDKDHCIECQLCVKACDQDAIDLTQQPENLDLTVGIIVVATGFEPFNPIGVYGYGRYENVITQLELERILAPNGPTEGKLRRITGDKVPKRILMIQCVGSRSPKTHDYCSSGICCMVAIKNARLLKQHDPEAEITIAYIDIRASGKRYEEYYKEAREMGIKFLRGNVSKVKEDPKTKNITARIEDTLNNSVRNHEFDLVVLSVGMEPAKETSRMARMLGIDTSTDGYFKELHPRLYPITTKVPGVFLAGACQGPRSVDQTVATGKGAASASAILMSHGVYEMELIKAEIDLAKCSRCGLCVEVCPYHAISIKHGRTIVNEITCRGCGACETVCKNDAIELRYYRNRQLVTYIENLVQKAR